MKIIYSHFNNANHNDRSGFNNLEIFKLSNYLARAHGYETIFYGDQISVNFFQNVNFTEMYELNDIRIKEMPHNLWNISKFFSILQINEPFIHLDHDLFLFKKIDKNFLNQNIIYLHDEPHLDYETDRFQKIFSLQPLHCADFNNISYNCGIIGGQNFNIIKTVCNEIIEYIIDNKTTISSLLKDPKILSFANFFPCVLIEQVWMFQLFQYYKQEFKPLLEGQTFETRKIESFVKNIYHLQGSKVEPVINNRIIKLNKYLNVVSIV